jgi:ubiquinone/menaquinone biosynthesis C-methylase UbiE
MMKMKSKARVHTDNTTSREKYVKRFDLHFLEDKLMISPIKKLMFKFFEFQIFKWLLKPLNIEIKEKIILEAGCGAGYSFETISKSYFPKEYYAFDLNEKMVRKSFGRIKKNKLSVKVFQGNITKIPFKSNKFDVVLIFTVLHHVTKWREALQEVHRILKPNGVILINEINQRSLDRFERYAKVSHPKNARFTWRIFKRELLTAGFVILNDYYFLQDFGFFILLKK